MRILLYAVMVFLIAVHCHATDARKIDIRTSAVIQHLSVAQGTFRSYSYNQQEAERESMGLSATYVYHVQKHFHAGVNFELASPLNFDGKNWDLGRPAYILDFEPQFNLTPSDDVGIQLGFIIGANFLPEIYSVETRYNVEFLRGYFVGMRLAMDENTGFFFQYGVRYSNFADTYYAAPTMPGESESGIYLYPHTNVSYNNSGAYLKIGFSHLLK
ncbi:hypothetical protein K8I28_09955 [bacterium]|nr:hypothetical protein [bacterium]